MSDISGKFFGEIRIFYKLIAYSLLMVLCCNTVISSSYFLELQNEHEYTGFIALGLLGLYLFLNGATQTSLSIKLKESISPAEEEISGALFVYVLLLGNAIGSCLGIAATQAKLYLEK